MYRSRVRDRKTEHLKLQRQNWLDRKAGENQEAVIAPENGQIDGKDSIDTSRRNESKYPKFLQNKQSAY